MMLLLLVVDWGMGGDVSHVVVIAMVGGDGDV